METTDAKSHLSFHQQLELRNYTIEQCRAAIELLEKRIKQLANADYQSYMEKEIKDLGLYQRAYTVLIQARIATVGSIMIMD